MSRMCKSGHVYMGSGVCAHCYADTQAEVAKLKAYVDPLTERVVTLQECIARMNGPKQIVSRVLKEKGLCWGDLRSALGDIEAIQRDAEASPSSKSEVMGCRHHKENLSVNGHCRACDMAEYSAESALTNENSEKKS